MPKEKSILAIKVKKRKTRQINRKLNGRKKSQAVSVKKLKIGEVRSRKSTNCGRTRSKTEETCEPGSKSSPSKMLNYMKPMSPNPPDSMSNNVLTKYLKSSCGTTDNNTEASQCSAKDLKHFYQTIDSTAIMTENHHLKELVVSQLDLIQQQSETILARERQMDSLRKENEHLRQRLERMERRCRPDDAGDEHKRPAGARAKKSSHSSMDVTPKSGLGEAPRGSGGIISIKTEDNAHSTGNSRQLKEIELQSQPEAQASMQDNHNMGRVNRIRKRSGPPSRETERDTKRVRLEEFIPDSSELQADCQTKVLSQQVIYHSEYQGDTLVDEIIADTDDRFGLVGDAAFVQMESDAEQSFAKGIRIASSHVEKQLRQQTVDAARLTSCRSANEGHEMEMRSRRSHPSGNGLRCDKPSKSGRTSRMSLPSESYPPLFTKHMYYIGCSNEIANTDDQLTHISTLQRGVEVPRWREDPLYEKYLNKNKMSIKTKEVSSSPVKSNCVDDDEDELEIVEESSMLKRHEKPEAMEKRTKKWDLQRMRQKCYNDKLRARYENSGRNKRNKPESLLPIPEAAVKIRVCGDGMLPVTAFGECVPSLTQTPFSLPWIHDTDGKSDCAQSRQDASRKLRQ